MAFPSTKWIWLDGEFLPWDDARVHVTTHALHYGSSVFEGIRAYGTPRGAAILGLEQHLRRLFDSARMMRIAVPYTKEQVRQAILGTVSRNELTACYIRPLIFRGSQNFSLDGRNCPTHATIISFEWGRYLGEEATEQGVDVMVSSWRRMAPDTFLAMSKAGGNYVNSQFVAMEAADNGYVEGIALDIQGYVSEGSGENVFLVHQGVIYTPPFGASILQGVNRGFAITLARDLGYDVREQVIPRDMLYLADEVFFTGTAAEITPVRSIDRMQVGAGKRGPVTARLQDEFFGIVSGERPDRYGWMTPVMRE